MSRKADYSVTRVPSNDWNNIMETVSLDGSYSHQIKDEVWAAIENMEDFSNPWVVVKIKDGRGSAKIFGDKDVAQRYMEKSKKSSKANEEYFCIKATYQSRW
jgi:hypothetical protein